MKRAVKRIFERNKIWFKEKGYEVDIANVTGDGLAREDREMV